MHESVNRLTFEIIENGLTLQIVYPKISTYLVQLFSMWMVEVKDEMFRFFDHWSKKKVRNFFNNVFVHDQYYGLIEIKENSQKARCVEGISVLLKLAVDNEQLWMFVSDVMPALVKYAIEFTEEILIPNRVSGDDLERWQIEHEAHEKRR